MVSFFCLMTSEEAVPVGPAVLVQSGRRQGPHDVADPDPDADAPDPHEHGLNK